MCEKISTMRNTVFHISNVLEMTLILKQKHDVKSAWLRKIFTSTVGLGGSDLAQ